MFKRWKRIAHQLGRFLIYYLFSPIQRQNIIYFLQFSGEILFIFSNSAAKYYLFSTIQRQNIIYFLQFRAKYYSQLLYREIKTPSTYVSGSGPTHLRAHATMNYKKERASSGRSARPLRWSWSRRSAL